MRLLLLIIFPLITLWSTFAFINSRSMLAAAALRIQAKAEAAEEETADSPARRGRLTRAEARLKRKAEAPIIRVLLIMGPEPLKA